MTTVETAWRPVAPEGVQIAPALWNGTSLVVEAAAHRGGRIYTLGAAEALVLEALREPGTVDEIADRVKESSGLAISLRSVERIINIFLVHGLVVRPTGTVPQEAQDIDPASQEQASSQHPSPASPPRALQVITSCAWGVAGTRIAPVLALLCIAVGAMVAAGVVSGWSQITASVKGLTGLGPLGVILSVTGAVIWHLVSQCGHEIAHGIAFVRLAGGRLPVLSVTFLGPVPMPSTRLDGLGLIRSRQRALAIVLAGPLFTLAMAALPAGAALLGTAGTGVAAWGSLSLLIDLTIVILSLTPFPNTDMTRGLEMLVGVKQLPLAALRARRGTPVPQGLPRLTRLAITCYPVVLLTAFLVVAAWSGLLISSLI